MLNVLVGIAFLIAVSGWLIRLNGGAGQVRRFEGRHAELAFGVMLIVYVIASQVVRRRWRTSGRSMTPDERRRRFYRSHVAAALLGAACVPFGLFYALAFDPRLQGVAPFWVVALAMGFLAIPRRGELDDGNALPPSPEVPSA